MQQHSKCPGLGEDKIPLGTQKPCRTQQRNIKRAYQKSVEQEHSFVAFTSLKTNANLLSSRKACAFQMFRQNISSRTDFVRKSGLGAEMRENASWPVPVTYQSKCCLLPAGRKEQRNEGRKEESQHAGPENYQRNREHASSTNV